ncbi:MAG: hypothetical protein MUF34_04290 [Polyangiaceae bacterium]|nr:hypothetical protein [Polyangiaceae bacterium]
MAKGPSPLLGFNNNVRHRGKIFHIQTEDSGVRHPHVITHLFSDGGRIIKTTKTSYADHIGDEGMAIAVRQLMKEQHKAMFLALRNGLFDDAIEGGGGESAAPKADRPPVAMLKSERPPAPPAPEPPASVATPATPLSTPRPELTTFEPPPSALEPFEPFPPSTPLSASLPDYMAPPSAPQPPPHVPAIPPAPLVPQGPPRATPGHHAAPPSARGAVAAPPSARALPRPMPPPSRQAPPSAPGRVPPLPAPALPPRPTSFGAPSREVRPPAEARHVEALPPPPSGERRPGAPSLRALHEPLPPSEAAPPSPPATGAPRAASRSSFPRSTRPPGGRSIFGDDLISEKSLDEVILSYLADDLDGTSNLP